jgi:prevent-host-death family protein
MRPLIHIDQNNEIAEPANAGYPREARFSLICNVHQKNTKRYFAVVFCLKYSYTFHQQEGFIMPAIKPISELRNYNTVLREVTADSPVFLTKNGHGRFAIVDIRAYEKLRTELDLMSALADGEESARKGGWVSMDSAMRKLGV